MTLENPQTSDIMGISSITNDAPESFPLGETVVTWTAIDTSGNSSSDTQLVTVVDTTAPSIIQPENITVEATGLGGNMVELDLIIAEDNIGVGSITNDAPATFEFGTTTVSWIALDDAGNTATVQQNISLVDTTEPSIILPNDIEIEAVSNHSNIIEIGVAIGSDNIQLGQVTNDAPESFPLGETVVTWTATDTSGNSVSDTQLVTVQICGNSPSYYNMIMGTAEDDFITGTNLPDLIFSNGGDDIIIGNNGNDCIFAGEGSDIIFGNSGDDNITGGQGNDIIKGGSGDDTLKGGIGLDMIDGGDDIDRCIIIDEQNSDLVVKCEVNE